MESRSTDFTLSRNHVKCANCGEAIPAAILVEESQSAAYPEAIRSLLPRDYVIGRSANCDIVPIGADDGVSRRHARLIWSDGVFQIADEGSSNGTLVNDRELAVGERIRLENGARIRLGELSLTFHEVQVGTACQGRVSYDRLLGLIREMTSLDIKVVVDHALELLQAVSGVERGFLVDAGADPRLRPLLTPLDDPELKISRSSISEALKTGEKVSRYLGPDLSDAPMSIQSLGVRRLWVSPVKDDSGRPVAAVYLDSLTTGGELPAETERLMDAVVDQIGMALRNATLHERVVSLSENLEHKVVERTRQLDDSRKQLIAQDRLATLGRLVAAIAHELNNPAGAIASFAGTLEGMKEALLGFGTDLSSAFPDEADAEAAMQLIDRALRQQGYLDSRGRRILESGLESYLASEGVPSAGALARRFARAGLDDSALRPHLDLLRRDGESLARLTETAHAFGRGLGTIRNCAASIARIVDGLKTYAHLDRAVFEEVDIHQGIEATLTVLESRIPGGIRVETRFDEIQPFPQRPGELAQVWTNLIDNAVRAMGDRGSLEIETRDEGETVRVRVSDTGPGVPEELRERVFDLDFTTRGPGAGLGLGLPICRTIVEENHGGRISFESGPDGTEFTVILPKKPEASEETGS